MRLLVIFSLFTVFAACESKKSTSDYEAYFYPIQKEVSFYVYRDIKNGLNEQIHRIYSLTDSYGEHLIVEVYTGDGRIIEAYNYNTDSLNLIDHMVVNAQGKKQKAELLKNEYFPADAETEAYFASRFPGIYDSTFILREVKRKVAKNPTLAADVLGKKVDILVCNDYIRQSLFNPFQHKENVVEGHAKTYFAKGYGLVEWFDEKDQIHFKLEQVLDEKEGIKLIAPTK
ncbi:MAG: hypothetical protein N4A41_13265 [Crocinitomicaceae bacterium]|jgi:hypothetical protein|nr:hypothetical protein [Crocinitomicaceae bacterium]